MIIRTLGLTALAGPSTRSWLTLRMVSSRYWLQPRSPLAAMSAGLLEV